MEILSDISWSTLRLSRQRQASKVEEVDLPQSQNDNRQQKLEEMKKLAEILADVYTNILGEPEITDSSMMADKMAA